MARGISVSPDFAALLAFGPPVLGVKAASSDNRTTSTTVSASPVARLREAKGFSDAGDYASKNKILSELVAADPSAFVVDSPNEKYPGITHTQSNFRIHTHPTVAAQIKPPEPTLIDLLDMNRDIQSGQNDAEKMGAAVAKPKTELPYRDRAEMYAIDKDGNVFGGLHEQGNFGVFGGGIEDGEDPADAAAREFQEESGWSVTNPRVLPFQPHAVDWTPPYKSKKQAERAKQYRGSRTYYIVGDLGEKIPDAVLDEANRTQVRPYGLDEAIRLAVADKVTDPVLVAANAKRKAVLEHIKAQRSPLMVKSAHYKKLCSKCDKVISSCRCMSKTKEIQYGLCKECGGTEKEAAFEDAPVTVCVDLDGTLAKKEVPFSNKTIGKPRKKIRTLVRLLKKRKCRIIVWTVRGDTKLVKKWLREHAVPYDFINENPDQPPGASGKLYADVYLDDKAVSAEDADAAIRTVLERIAPLLAERTKSHA